MQGKLAQVRGWGGWMSTVRNHQEMRMRAGRDVHVLACACVCAHARTHAHIHSHTPKASATRMRVQPDEIKKRLEEAKSWAMTR